MVAVFQSAKSTVLYDSVFYISTNGQTLGRDLQDYLLYDNLACICQHCGHTHYPGTSRFLNIILLPKKSTIQLQDLEQGHCSLVGFVYVWIQRMASERLII